MSYSDSIKLVRQILRQRKMTAEELLEETLWQRDRPIVSPANPPTTTAYHAGWDRIFGEKKQ